MTYNIWGFEIVNSSGVINFPIMPNFSNRIDFNLKSKTQNIS